MGEKIYEILSNKTRWQKLSRAGIRGARNTYTWGGHVETYISEICRVLGKISRNERRFSLSRSRLPTANANHVSGDSDALLFDFAVKTCIRLMSPTNLDSPLSRTLASTAAYGRRDD